MTRVLPGATPGLTANTAAEPAKAPAVAKAAAVTTPVAVQGLVDASAEVGIDLLPAGQQLSASASTGSLWGGPKRAWDGLPNRDELRSMTPQAQKGALAKISDLARELSTQVRERRDTLDDKWDHGRNSKRLEILIKGGWADRMPPAAGTELKAVLAKAAAIDAKLVAGRARANAWGPVRNSKASPEERAALAKELKSLRREYTEVMGRATQLLEDHGMKDAMLEGEESRILPPPEGEPSLRELSTAVSDVGLLQAFIASLVTLSNPVLAEQEHQVEKAREALKEQDERFSRSQTKRARTQHERARIDTSKKRGQ